MSIEIRKLTPDLAEEYAYFFDTTPHNDEDNGVKCYCVTWRSGGWNDEGNDHWFPAREERRERAIGFVKDSYIQGYLAYNGDKIVGFCNANADCQGCIDYLRNYWPIEEYRADIKVKSIFCFVIAPEMQRKGIATLLVEKICKDAIDDGFDFVEAYADINIEKAARGPFKMYEKCGFIIYAEREGHVVMRKILK
jgi:ribosomal protein S18 acetylase RimI-like enzyme